MIQIPNNKFSVLMAVYLKDDPELLKMALDSVYNNTITPDELILVEDGPLSEALTSIINQFTTKPGFRIITLPENLGLSFALNQGLSYVTYEYVFRADADDYNLPERFERQLPYLIQGFDLVGSTIQEIDRLKCPLALRDVPKNSKEILKFARLRNPFNHMSVCYRLSSIIDIGGYPNIHLKEDYALWGLMIKHNKRMINLSEILVHATAGSDLYKRRGGIQYAISELQLQRFLIKLKIQPLIFGLIIGSMRFIVFLFPASIRGLIYRNYLRRKIL